IVPAARVAAGEFFNGLLHGAVGGMVVPEEVQRYAEQQGLYVLTQVDGVVMIKNQPDFVAKTW
ncbi:hypothetical protein, partial [Tepidimonas ignava]|uniref:hypothetical protein n=1 Tax=Tepidimonas ignava TaxID=114249 RepID=UPI002FDA861F